MPSRTSRHGECSAKKAVVTELRWRSTPACSKQSSDCSSLRPMNKPPAASQQLVDAYRSHRPTTLPDTGNAEERSRPATAIVQLVRIRQSINAQKIPSSPPCNSRPHRKADVDLIVVGNRGHGPLAGLM